MRFFPTAASTAAPFARFAFPRETNSPEHSTARVANLADEASVIREKLVALLDVKQHSYPPLPRGAIFNERLGWSDPRITLATEPCAKVGSLQPNTAPGRVQIERSAMLNSFPFRTLAQLLW